VCPAILPPLHIPLPHIMDGLTGLMITTSSQTHAHKPTPGSSIYKKKTPSTTFHESRNTNKKAQPRQHMSRPVSTAHKTPGRARPRDPRSSILTGPPAAVEIEAHKFQRGSSQPPLSINTYTILVLYLHSTLIYPLHPQAGIWRNGRGHSVVNFSRLLVGFITLVTRFCADCSPPVSSPKFGLLQFHHFQAENALHELCAESA
jgi:hypothetical protein